MPQAGLAQRLPLKPLLLVLAAATAGYAVVLMLFGERSTLAILGQLWSWVGVQAAALCIVNYVLRGLRWRMWMTHYGRQLGLLEGLRLYLASYTFTPTPGNIGEAARGLLLARNPLSAAQSLALFLAERVADLLCLLLLCLPLVGLLLDLLPGHEGLALRWGGWAVAVLVLAAALLFMAWRRWRHRWEGSSVQAAWQCLAWQPLRWFSLTLVAWAAQGWAVWLLCSAAGLDLSALRASALYATAMVGGALSFLPAGLGGTEALLSGLLILQGASTAQALGITVLVRLLTLGLAVAIGALALVYSAVIRRDISFQ